ncbi:MAG: ABC transporter permease subunit [Cryobacterium sp.]|nr:ABC transporter permease subunit [Oligoflexia bacterium]
MIKTLHFPVRKLQIGDLVVLILVGFTIYAVITTAQRWKGVYQPDVVISLSRSALPLYALFSVSRAILAYGLSLVFTLIFGYAAAKNRFAERIIMPILDIGQSIPVLGFLPGLVLGLVAVFPKSNVGIELACVIMIFTGQVWNMAFSYISSLKAVPVQLHEMTDNIGLGKFQKLLKLELPCAATGLAWNSLMSMAGGWFFLTICEAFTLGEKNFRVPGLGSYMALAIEKNDSHAMIAGVLTMAFVIIFMDFVIWRPIVSWTGKFRLTETLETGAANIPSMSLLLRGSKVFQAVSSAISDLLNGIGRSRTNRLSLPNAVESSSAKKPRVKTRRMFRVANIFDQSKILRSLIVGALGLICFVVIGKVFVLVEPVRWVDWERIFVGTTFTFLRVVSALIIASVWSIPAGIVIGLSPKLTRLFQPLIQLGASFPAPMLYPIALTVFTTLGIGLGISSSLLMLLGVQWYILFNVLAGAIGISNDLRESFHLMGLSRKTKWLKLYLPSVFPFLVTGWVTAAGGAWNASIIAEYLQYRGSTLHTVGLGALISESTSSGNFHTLAACLIAMVVTVVSINRVVWSRVYQLAEKRYRFER